MIAFSVGFVIIFSLSSIYLQVCRMFITTKLTTISTFLMEDLARCIRFFLLFRFLFFNNPFKNQQLSFTENNENLDSKGLQKRISLTLILFIVFIKMVTIIFDRWNIFRNISQKVLSSFFYETCGFVFILSLVSSECFDRFQFKLV